jgi:hypothetical protein
VIDPALVVGILAAVVAVLGYTITNAMNRVERRSRIYADAMLALVQFEIFPSASAAEAIAATLREPL